MKTKKLYTIISVFLLAGAGMSGCDKVVKSAVVAEENTAKEKTDSMYEAIFTL